MEVVVPVVVLDEMPDADPLPVGKGQAASQPPPSQTPPAAETAPTAETPPPQSQPPPASQTPPASQPSPPPPPIDAVFTWVNGRDPLHTFQRNKYLPPAAQRRHADMSGKRWLDGGEIQYSLRSVFHFAPFVRHVFIITSHKQVPQFLDRAKIILVHDAADAKTIPATGHRLILVNDTVLFEAARMSDHLPTFNSQAIEAHIHRIPGLAERFIYLCDDMFLIRPVVPGDFFTGDDQPIAMHCGGVSYGSKRRINERTPGHAAARINAHRLLDRLKETDKETDKAIELFDLSHHAKAATKTLFREAWDIDLIKRAFTTTSKSRFRGHDNVEIFTVVLLRGARLRRVAMRHLLPSEQVWQPSGGPASRDLQWIKERSNAKFFAVNNFSPAHAAFFSELLPARDYEIAGFNQLQRRKDQLRKMTLLRRQGRTSLM